MRVIAGKYRSLPLKTPKGLHTRPTTDRIKETLFNMISPYIPGSKFLDLFSGSGGIGLEAVSRGADKVYLVENSREALDCIKDNIHFTKAEEHCTVCGQDVMTALHSLEGQGPMDIIFMDPPYGMEHERQVLETLAHGSLVNEDTLIIVEADLETQFDYLEELGFEMIKYKKYKTNAHIFIKKWDVDERTVEEDV